MRKLTTFAALALVALFALPAFGKVTMQKARFAQKGKIHVGGEFAWSSMTEQMTEPEKGDETKTGSTRFAPTVGYFVIPSLELGVMLDYTKDTREPEGQDETETSMFSGGVFAAYHYKMNPILYPYGRFSYMHLLSYDDGSDNDYSGNEIRIGAGLGIAFGHKVGGRLGIGLDYVMQKRTMTPDGGNDDYTTENNGIQLMTSFSVYFGG